MESLNGLVNQELLLQSEYQAAGEPRSASYLPARLRRVRSQTGKVGGD